MEDHGYQLRTASAVMVAAYVDSRVHSHETRKQVRTALAHYWRLHGRREAPVGAIRVPRRPRMVCRAIEPAQARTLALSALRRGDRKGLAVLLALYLGLRRFEIAKIRWDAFTADGWMSVMGKGDQPAVLPVHPLLREALGRLDREGSPWVFAGRFGGPVSPATIWTWVREVAEEAGLGVVPPHVLRHVALATANDNLGDLRAVQDFARHANPSTTAGYTRTTARKLTAVMSSLDYLDEQPVGLPA